MTSNLQNCDNPNDIYQVFEDCYNKIAGEEKEGKLTK